MSIPQTEISPQQIVPSSHNDHETSLTSADSIFRFDLDIPKISMPDIHAATAAAARKIPDPTIPKLPSNPLYPLDVVGVNTRLKQYSEVDEENVAECDETNPVRKLKKLLKAGIKLHTKKAIESINIEFVDNEFRWVRWTKKRYRLDLTKVVRIKAGKLTDNFLKGESDAANPDHTFSLICDDTTVDLQAPSKHDRDCLVILLRRILGLPVDPEDEMPPDLVERFGGMISSNADRIGGKISANMPDIPTVPAASGVSAMLLLPSIEDFAADFLKSLPAMPAMLSITGWPDEEQCSSSGQPVAESTAGIAGEDFRKSAAKSSVEGSDSIADTPDVAAVGAGAESAALGEVFAHGDAPTNRTKTHIHLVDNTGSTGSSSVDHAVVNADKGHAAGAKSAV